MAIQTNSIREKVWDTLISIGTTPAGAAGIMGNLHSQSIGINPNAVEGLLITRYKSEGFLSWPDGIYDPKTWDLYTQRVDNGTISKAEFISPRQYTGAKHQYGYGMVQWTTAARKERLWSYTRGKGKSISDIQGQIECLVYELKNSFPSVWSVVSKTNTVNEAADIVLTKFESPANADSLKATRRGYANQYYNLYKNRKVNTTMAKQQITNKTFLAAVRNSYLKAHNGNYRYGDSHGWPPTSDGVTSCDRLVADALYNMGYTDQPRIANSTSGITVNNVDTYLPRYGFKKITNKANIKPGAVIGVGQNGNQITHVFVVVDYDPKSDLCSKYDFGSQDRIRANQPYRNVKLNEWPSRHFIAAYNVPIQEGQSSTVPQDQRNYLMKGDTGTAVKTLQNNLNYVYNYGLEVDGSFGAKTDEAVRKFQKAAGLEVDGLYGQASKAKLQSLVSAKKAEEAKKEAEKAKESAGSGQLVNWSNYTNKISNSGHDENGKYSGGVAGDQTGGEWSIINWYNRPWNYVLRYPDEKVASWIALVAIEAANNNKIGYDQNQRTTYWTQLSKSQYRPKNITTACEADCSAGVAANVKAVGYLLGLGKLQSLSKDIYTGNLRSAFKNAGFQVLTDSKYLNSSNYLLPGDILLYEGHHTATNLGIGKSTGRTSFGNGVVDEIGSNASSLNIKEIQSILNSAGWSLDVDGSYGQKTTAAVKEFQKLYELEVDGIVGPNTAKVLNELKAIIADGFDANYYSSTYSDVKAAFGTDKKQLLHHYYKYGKKQGRKCKKPADAGSTPAQPQPVQPTPTPAPSNTLTLNTTGKYSETVKANGVITTLLNIRKGPGTQYANLVSYPTLPANTKVGLCDMVRDKNGGIWYFIKINNAKYGFANANYIKIV